MTRETRPNGCRRRSVHFFVRKDQQRALDWSDASLLLYNRRPLRLALIYFANKRRVVPQMAARPFLLSLSLSLVASGLQFATRSSSRLFFGIGEKTPHTAFRHTQTQHAHQIAPWNSGDDGRGAALESTTGCSTYFDSIYARL